MKQKSFGTIALQSIYVTSSFVFLGLSVIEGTIVLFLNQCKITFIFIFLQKKSTKIIIGNHSFSIFA